jgi:hypothetical protein
MSDIELRFVEAIEPIDGNTGKVIRKLQFRKLELDGWENECWTEWQDVPFVREGL